MFNLAGGVEVSQKHKHECIVTPLFFSFDKNDVKKKSVFLMFCGSTNNHKTSLISLLSRSISPVFQYSVNCNAYNTIPTGYSSNAG